jgi:hypothetical protein
MWEWTVAPVRGRIAQVCVPVSDALGPTSSSLRTPESVAVLRAVLAPRWEDRLVIQTAASFSADGRRRKEGKQVVGGWKERRRDNKGRASKGGRGAGWARMGRQREGGTWEGFIHSDFIFGEPSRLLGAQCMTTSPRTHQGSQGSCKEDAHVTGIEAVWCSTFGLGCGGRRKGVIWTHGGLPRGGGF